MCSLSLGSLAAGVAAMAAAEMPARLARLIANGSAPSHALRTDDWQDRDCDWLSDDGCPRAYKPVSHTQLYQPSRMVATARLQRQHISGYLSVVLPSVT